MATQSWLHPAPDSVDTLSLFTLPNTQWPLARPRISVYEFFRNQVMQFGGTYQLSNFVAANAFNQLTAWGIDVALEIGVLKPGNEDAVAGFSANTKTAMHNVVNNGGNCKYLVMDEPFVGGCLDGSAFGQGIGTLTAAQAAHQVRLFYDNIHAEFPNALLIDTEPIGHGGQAFVSTAATIINWLGLLLGEGVPLYAYQLEGDIGTITAQDVIDVRDYCVAHSIVFGVVFHGVNLASQPTTDQQWHDQSMTFVTLVNGAIGAPGQSNWAVIQPGSLPHNLPETDPDSLTRLVRDGLAALTPPPPVADFTYLQTPATLTVVYTDTSA